MVIVSLLRLVRRHLAKTDWWILAVLALIHLILTWAVYAVTEAPDAPLIEPGNYWYYWWTTALTVGYGDLSPQSAHGRLFAPFAMATSIALVTAALGKLIVLITDTAEKRRKGLMPIKTSGHILVLGDYDATETRSLLEAIAGERGDDNWRTTSTTVVCCFRNTGDRNPIKGLHFPCLTLEYVQATDGHLTKLVIQNCNVGDAEHIYVSAGSDTDVVGIVSMLSQYQINARVALLLKHEESRAMVPALNLDLALILPVQPLLAVREMEDPGTSAAVQQLIGAGGHSIYSLCPSSERGDVRFAEVQNAFKELFEELGSVVGISYPTNASWTANLFPGDATPVNAADCILYISTRDLSPEEEARFEETLRTRAS